MACEKLDICAMLELNICSSGDDTGEYAGGFIRSVLRTGVLVTTSADITDVSWPCCAVCSSGGIMNGIIAPSGVSLKNDKDRSCVEGFDDMLLWFGQRVRVPQPRSGVRLYYCRSSVASSAVRYPSSHP